MWRLHRAARQQTTNDPTTSGKIATGSGMRDTPVATCMFYDHFFLLPFAVSVVCLTGPHPPLLHRLHDRVESRHLQNRRPVSHQSVASRLIQPSGTASADRDVDPPTNFVPQPVFPPLRFPAQSAAGSKASDGGTVTRNDRATRYAPNPPPGQLVVHSSFKMSVFPDAFACARQR